MTDAEQLREWGVDPAIHAGLIESAGLQIGCNRYVGDVGVLYVPGSWSPRTSRLYTRYALHNAMRYALLCGVPLDFKHRDWLKGHVVLVTCPGPWALPKVLLEGARRRELMDELVGRLRAEEEEE